jgi:hypothetical protein
VAADLKTKEERLANTLLQGDDDLSHFFRQEAMARKPTLMIGHSAKLMQIQRQVILEDQLYAREDADETPGQPQDMQMAPIRSDPDEFRDDEEAKMPFLFHSEDSRSLLGEEQDVGFIGKLGDVYLKNQLC